jgi:hypothetical protein
MDEEISPREYEKKNIKFDIKNYIFKKEEIIQNKKTN